MSSRKTKDFGSCNVLFSAIGGVGNSSFAFNKGSLLLLPPRSKGITSKSRADSFSASFYISSLVLTRYECRNCELALVSAKPPTAPCIDRTVNGRGKSVE